MKIQNVSNDVIIFSDLLNPDRISAVKLNPGEIAVVFNEDAEKSLHLIELLNQGKVQIIGWEEPTKLDGSPSQITIVDSWEE